MPGPWRGQVLPALSRRLPASARIGMGTSLGALAALHAHCRYPDAFDALFLQSGSFFCPRFDGHESGFRYYRRMVRFVASVPDGAVPAGRPVPTALTCGAIEENVGQQPAHDRGPAGPGISGHTA